LREYAEYSNRDEIVSRDIFYLHKNYAMRYARIDHSGPRENAVTIDKTIAAGSRVRLAKRAEEIHGHFLEINPKR